MPHNVALVIAEFHKLESAAMKEEAHRVAEETGMSIVEEVWIPGSMEAPLAAKRLMMNSSIDGLAVMGIIERGETAHGLVMAQAVITALVQLQLDFMKPLGMGILGPDIFPSQIAPRVRPYARAAMFALHHMLKGGCTAAYSGLQ